MKPTRRVFLQSSLAAAVLPRNILAADPIAPYRTPYKYPSLILKATGAKPDFDALSVDDPIVFRANGRFHMLYIGFDGTGYQTGLASSPDLIAWTRTALVGPRDPASKYTKYNLAISSILRDKNLHGSGEALKIDGDYLAAWNAYPSAGYEEGAAVIGLARSPDLLHWTLTDPILTPDTGAPWEHGGLYRPDLLLDRGTYHLYYNAKTDTLPKSEGGGWHEQTGVATSTDLKTWTRSPLNPILRNGFRSPATMPSAPSFVPLAKGGVSTEGRPSSSKAPGVPSIAPSVMNGPASEAYVAPDARDSRFASNPYVVKNGSRYAMFYFGFGYQRPGRACEMLALAPDPLHFTKIPEILIDTGPPGTIDETFAHKPSVICQHGALYHFYCAVAGKYPNETRGIAVARSKPFS